MFGLNDNNSTAPAGDNAPADMPQALPPSPFADNSTEVHPQPAAMAASPMPAAPEPSLPSLPQEPLATPAAVPDSAPISGDALLSLKQDALHELQPLVSHLNQTPEEKFKTTMMLIQATDNSSLVKEAYAAANQITDEKARAQALLDIVNEINYFTHKEGGSQPAA